MAVEGSNNWNNYVYLKPSVDYFLLYCVAMVSMTGCGFVKILSWTGYTLQRKTALWNALQFFKACLPAYLRNKMELKQRT